MRTQSQLYNKYLKVSILNCFGDRYFVTLLIDIISIIVKIFILNGNQRQIMFDDMILFATGPSEFAACGFYNEPINFIDHLKAQLCEYCNGRFIPNNNLCGNIVAQIGYTFGKCLN